MHPARGGEHLQGIYHFGGFLGSSESQQTGAGEEYSVVVARDDPADAGVDVATNGNDDDPQTEGVDLCLAARRAGADT